MERRFQKSKGISLFQSTNDNQFSYQKRKIENNEFTTQGIKTATIAGNRVINLENRRMYQYHEQK